MLLGKIPLRLYYSKKVALKTFLSFLLSLILCSALIVISINNKLNIERMTMERVIIDKSTKLTEIITKLLYKTNSLAALAVQNSGEIRDFERVAATIIDNPAILNIIIAPNGVVSNVYPLQGNESVVGYNLLGPGEGNREARLARDKGELVFGGPFSLVQGGQGLVGRLPVFRDEDGSGKKFWGLVSVTLKFPEVLRDAGLETLEKDGFAFELWRINPDSGKRQSIARSAYAAAQNARYIERHLSLLNADWYFRILPVRGWHEYSENWILLAIALCVSLLLAVIVRNNCYLKDVKGELETMVRTDSLTGILNRKGLFHHLEKLYATGESFVLYYIDLDYFKQINDINGHAVGDRILQTFTRRISRNLTGNHIFARLSGDEFALIHRKEKAADTEDEVFWQAVDREFSRPVVSVGGEDIKLSFSIGKAEYPADATDVDALISFADKKMYEDKNERYAREHRRRLSDFC